MLECFNRSFFFRNCISRLIFNFVCVMSLSKSFESTATVRDCHIYRNVWALQLNENLNCHHEEGNLFDNFAIKTCCRTDNEIVGHLPQEISRPTMYLLDTTCKPNHFKFFKGCLPQISFGPFLNTLSHLLLWKWYHDYLFTTYLVVPMI